eukprot:553407_1
MGNKHSRQQPSTTGNKHSQHKMETDNKSSEDVIQSKLSTNMEKYNTKLRQLEFDILIECLAEVYPDIDMDKEKCELLQHNVTHCVRYVNHTYETHWGRDTTSKKYIKDNYLKKLKKALHKLNGIDITIKCQKFDTNEKENKSSATFNHSDSSSIRYNKKLNETTITYNTSEVE